jgi:hypothetical protein
MQASDFCNVQILVPFFEMAGKERNRFSSAPKLVDSPNLYFQVISM